MSSSVLRELTEDDALFAEAFGDTRRLDVAAPGRVGMRPIRRHDSWEHGGVVSTEPPRSGSTGFARAGAGT